MPAQALRVRTSRLIVGPLCALLAVCRATAGQVPAPASSPASGGAQAPAAAAVARMQVEAINRWRRIMEAVSWRRVGVD